MTFTGRWAAGMSARTPDAGIEAECGSGARGGCQQQILEVAGKNLDGFFFRLVTQDTHQVEFQVQGKLHLPGETCSFHKPLVARAAPVSDAIGVSNHLYGGQDRGDVVSINRQVDRQDAFVATTEQRKGTVARDLRPLFGIVEIVGEFCTFFRHPVDEFRLNDTTFLDMAAQAADQLGVFGKAFHQDLASTVKRRLGVGNALAFIHVSGRFGLGVSGGIVQKSVGQRFQAGFAGNLRLGATLLLERQIDVLKLGLCIGCLDAGDKIVGELALLFDGFGYGDAAVFHFAQINQPLFELAQLGVVKPTGGFLPVAGDEWHRRTFVQHLDGRIHLAGLAADFIRDPLCDAQGGLGGQVGLGSGRGRVGHRYACHLRRVLSVEKNLSRRR